MLNVTYSLFQLKYTGNFINVLCIQRSSEVTRIQRDDFSQREHICVTRTQIKKPSVTSTPEGCLCLSVTSSEFCDGMENLACFLPAVNIDDFESTCAFLVVC